jgi:hypothetical protein
LLPESTPRSKHALLQVEPMSLRKFLLAQAMVRIQILPVMSGTHRDRREVRGLLPQSPGTQDVGMSRFDHGRTTADSRTDYASKRPNPCQILRASVRTLARSESLLANRYSLFWRQPRCNGTLRRSGTRLLSRDIGQLLPPEWTLQWQRELFQFNPMSCEIPRLSHESTTWPFAWHTER